MTLIPNIWPGPTAHDCSALGSMTHSLGVRRPFTFSHETYAECRDKATASFPQKGKVEPWAQMLRLNWHRLAG